MTDTATRGPRRLAIIGAGSSGLISLKHALDMLPGWRIKCFEKSDSITGAWGHPYDGFVSTSTKYTTQFSCYPLYDAEPNADGGASRSEFFRDGEYGEYLSRFADHFGLRERVLLNHRVSAVRRSEQNAGWNITYFAPDSDKPELESFDAVIFCTGLVAEPQSIGDHSPLTNLRGLLSRDGLNRTTNKKIVVIGGGEMAADLANRFSQPSLKNEVYLSLRSGIRVSPRYHPIRGVPSDFLRNRLLLSIHEDLRNAIGGWFVRTRIRRQAWFEWVFPAKGKTERSDSFCADDTAEQKRWAKKLNERAERGLFDMFHNKSDDFLSALGAGRLRIIGPPVDSSLTTFQDFDQQQVLEISPDLTVPAVGFRSTIAELTDGQAQVKDFYLGCQHTAHNDLFLVGFARPVIGNIPSISEMQARYVCRAIAGQIARPGDIVERHDADTAARRERFSAVDLNRLYPVEMFPYCDRLAREIGTPAMKLPREGLAGWWRVQTAPATTLDYACFHRQPVKRPKTATYLPLLLILALLALKPIDWLYKCFRRHRSTTRADSPPFGRRVSRARDSPL